jgi:hypothetical protein
VSPPGTYVALDPATVAALHLVRGPGGRRDGSLLAALDSTRTAVGAAWLRAAVLQPLAHAASLRLRHAAVAELVADPALAAGLDAGLAALPRELGKLYGWLALRPGRGGGGGDEQHGGPAPAPPPPRSIASLARSLTLLRAALAALPGLVAALADSRSDLLRAAGATLAHPAVSALAPALDAVLGGGGGGGEVGEDGDDRDASRTHHQDCFVVRADAAEAAAASTTAHPATPPILGPGDAALLTAAREALTAAAGAGAALATAYRAAAGPAARGLRLHHAQRRGFYLSLPFRVRGGGGGGGGGGDGAPPAWRLALPPGLVVTAQRGGCIELTSPELGAANARAKAAAEDCLALSAAALARAADRVTTGLPAAALQKAVDAVAVVDFLASLARAAGASPVPTTAPTMADPGAATVLAGVSDPLLLRAAAAAGLDAGVAVRANDAAFSPAGAALSIITGPNSAGKSTYLRAVGTAIVLAHIGAHVPAAHATVAVVHRVSLCGGGGGGGGGDGAAGGCLETGGSALGVEMRGIAAALSSAGPGTLLLLDEPGRATSTADGAALAWAVAEAALAARAPTFVTTHFPRLTGLADVYPTARAFHMDARLTVAAEGDGSGGGGAGYGGRDSRGGGVLGTAVASPPPPPGLGLAFTWRLRPGPCTARHYGLEIAPRAGMPPDVVAEAAAIASRIEADHGAGGGVGGGAAAATVAGTPHASDHALHSVAHRLAALAAVWVGGAVDMDVAVALRGLQGAAAAAIGSGGGV